MATIGDRIERLIDFGVAALFAIACAFPAFMLLPNLGQGALAIAALIGIAAFTVAIQVLGRIVHRTRAPVEFDLMPLPEFPAVALLDLGTADLIDADGSAESDEALIGPALELDVVLPEVGPESRVVQLFGLPSQATAGELAIRVDRHLARREELPQSPPDASRELFDALNQLRQSLR